MKTAQDLKTIVQEKYGNIARETKRCCGETSANMSEDYSSLPGYVPEADLGLGCGIPINIAALQPGETVLDLGSGAGNDVFVARSFVGDSGHVIGVDMTEAMVEKAEANAAKLGLENVEFRRGDIEALPLEANTIDVALSNCVLNLVPDKKLAFEEIYRVLKPGGRFCISDIVTLTDLPAAIREEAELYVGCIGGAMVKADYLRVIAEAGFTDIDVAEEKYVSLPADLLGEADSPVRSVTVVATKPA